MRSHLLEGVVRHRRARPFVYALEHDVYYVALDLDELDDVDRVSRLLGRNRRRRPGPPGRRSSRPARGDLRAAFLEHLRAHGEDPERLADHARHEPARARLRVQPGQLLPVPRRGRRRSGSWSWRSTTRTASAISTRCGRVTGPRRSSRLDGQGVLRLAVHRERTARYTVRVRDEATRLRITINHEQPDGLVLHASLDLVRRPLDGPEPRSDGSPASARDPQDHAADPLARTAPVAPRRSVPPPSRGCPMTARTVPSRRPIGVGPILERSAWRVALAAAERIRDGRLTVVLPDGSRRVYGDPASPDQAEIHIHDGAGADPDAARRRDRGRRGVHGRAVVQPGPRGLVAACGQEPRGARAARAAGSGCRLSCCGPSATGRAATRRTGSRRNIAAHYDLGNDFYRLFLDETMTYSSAVFATPDQDLADAQRNKYRVIAANAGLEAGQHVLEIGTGWGGFALYAAGELGCRVTSVTISQEQYDLARQRVARGRPRRTWSRSSCATIATSRGRTTRSSRSRCSRPSGPSTSGPSSRSATGRCDRAAG